MKAIYDPEQLNLAAQKAYAGSKVFFAKLKRSKPGNLDRLMQKLHERVFEEIDCLMCANCCKSISPMMGDRDVERMSSALKMKPSGLFEKYLETDEDGDYVFIARPCPLLLSDNRCCIYEQRPKACREYPHTDRRRIYQILDITLKNTFVCPAVYLIAEELKKSGIV